MSIKITHQREAKPAHPNAFIFAGSSQSNLDDVMMMTPQAKKFQKDCIGKDSPLSSYELFLPTEMDKLKKLFPLLDSKVSNTLTYLTPNYSNWKMFSMNVIKNVARPTTKSLKIRSESNKKRKNKRTWQPKEQDLLLSVR